MYAEPVAPPTDPQGRWVVYVLVSETTGRTYVGVSTDAARRLEQHNGQRPGGARTTRAGRPWRLATLYGPYAGRAEAQAVEHRVRELRGAQRLRWAEGDG